MNPDQSNNPTPPSPVTPTDAATTSQGNSWQVPPTNPAGQNTDTPQTPPIPTSFPDMSQPWQNPTATASPFPTPTSTTISSPWEPTPTTSQIPQPLSPSATEPMTTPTLGNQTTSVTPHEPIQPNLNPPITGANPFGATASNVASSENPTLGWNATSYPTDQTYATTTPTSETPSENAPTDLSGLIDTSSTFPISETSPQPTEPTPTSPPPQVLTSDKEGGFPKWVLILGGVILVGVIAASVYFILGVGQNKVNQTTSIPAEQAPLTTAPRRTASEPVASPQPATSSGTFGNLSGATPAATSSETSALDLLKQRQSAK